MEIFVRNNVMKYVFLLGNGFDLALGARSRFVDYFKWYIQEYSSSENCIFQSINEEGIETWADFENRLCKYYISKLDTKEKIDRFFVDFDEFKREFSKYLHIEEKRFNKKFYREFLPSFEYSIYYPFSELDCKLLFRNKIPSDIASRVKVDFIIFNYTDIASKLIGAAFHHRADDKQIIETDYPVKIHGDLDENMIIGYGEQIKIVNDALLEKNKSLAYLLCKTKYIESIFEKRYREALNSLNTADFIFIYGMSFGESDSHIWKNIIYQILIRDIYVIYFVYTKKHDGHDYLIEKEKIKKSISIFIDELGLPAFASKIIEEHFIFEHSYNIFYKGIEKKLQRI